jgi:plastocyanin
MALGRSGVKPALWMTACLAFLLIGCSETGTGDSGTELVDVVNISFATDPVQIEIGTDVTWINRDEGVHHSVTSGLPGDTGVPGLDQEEPPKPDGLFDGDLPEAGSSFSFTFTEAGTYPYFCRIHSSMTGEVVVG